MKAAVIYNKGEMPQYADVSEPVAQNEEELLINMKAVAIKHFDKARASQKHYSAGADYPKANVIGGDGVGLLADGTLVFGLGVSGTMAQKATIRRSSMVTVPAGLNSAVAAALPNAVAGSAMALLFRAALQPGETVLINGATGFTGKIAVQVARFYGAKKIIVTGRNPQSLQSLLKLGADEIISLRQDDQEFLAQIKAAHLNTPIDIVIDYLWGHSAELILASFKGDGSFSRRTRFVAVGAVTGDTIQLSAENLRSVNLQLSGSGIGSWTKNEMHQLFHKIIPDMFLRAAAGKLKVDIIPVKLAEVEQLWTIEQLDGKRCVVII